MEIPQLHTYLRMPVTMPPPSDDAPLPAFRLLPRAPRTSQLSRWWSQLRWDSDH